jgi:hypothetical protein
MCRYDIREYVMSNSSSSSSSPSPSPSPSSSPSPSPLPPENIETNAFSENNATTNDIGDSNETINDGEENRTRTRTTPRRIFSSSLFSDANINNYYNNLTNIAVESINELFEQNRDMFMDNGNSRLVLDPSNNMLLFETIISRNANNRNNHNRNNIV